MISLCEVCHEPLDPEENDGVTYYCGVCDRCGFCERCSKPENHDCDRTDTQRIDWFEDNLNMLDQIREDVLEGVSFRDALDRAIEGWEWNDEG